MKQKSIMAAVFLVFMIFPEQAVSQTKSEEPEKFELTINNIMKGDELVGTAPEAITWSWDGKMLYFQWQKPDEDKSKLYALKKKELHPKEIKDEDILKNIPLSQSTEYRFPRPLRSSSSIPEIVISVTSTFSDIRSCSGP